MRITNIQIKELFGIKELYLDGRSIELTGKNGVGKTSVIDAIKYGLTNSSERDYIIKNGETEGEIFIETDTGLSINRKPRTQQADYKQIKSNGKTVGSAESFLREIFTELQLNPVQFLKMSKNEQNRVILDMIDFEWDMNWIKEQFGEIPPNINWEQNILQILSDIQADDGYYFMTRQDINRSVREKSAIINDINESLPDNYNAERWEKEDLAAIYKIIETWRQENSLIEAAEQAKENYNNKIRSFQATKEISIASVDKEAQAYKSRVEKEILELEKEIEAKKLALSTLEEKKRDKLKVIDEQYNASVAKFDGEMSEHEKNLKLTKHVEDLEVKVEEAQTVEKMKGHINEYNRMIKLTNEVEVLKYESQALTDKIEKARQLPGEILETATIPVDGLTVVKGIPHIHGLPISNLSEGEKLDLCIDVTVNKPSGLSIILIDGAESLSTELRERIYNKCKAHGLQFVATRTTDSSSLEIAYLD